ncbi:MAG: hypothetical protein PHF84_12600, partial [bacterium]|nr:hypothetical protein [bacterium]
LNDLHCRMAGKFKVRFAINTDSHDTDTFWQIRLGIGVARRAGLEKKDIVNYSINDVLRKKAGRS